MRTKHLASLVLTLCGCPLATDDAGRIALGLPQKTAPQSMILRLEVGAPPPCVQLEVAAGIVAPTYYFPVTAGFTVELRTSDGRLFESCAPGAAPLPARFDLPASRLVTDAQGGRSVAPRDSRRIVGFVPCVSPSRVEAIGPTTLQYRVANFDSRFQPITPAQCCPANQSWCGGMCRDLMTDPAHCGGCGWACGGADGLGASCSQGGCVCGGGQFRCASATTTRTSCCSSQAQCMPDGTCGAP